MNNQTTIHFCHNTAPALPSPVVIGPVSFERRFKVGPATIGERLQGTGLARRAILAGRSSG